MSRWKVKLYSAFSTRMATRDTRDGEDRRVMSTRCRQPETSLHVSDSVVHCQLLCSSAIDLAPMLARPPTPSNTGRQAVVSARRRSSTTSSHQPLLHLTLIYSSRSLVRLACRRQHSLVGVGINIVFYPMADASRLRSVATTAPHCCIFAAPHPRTWVAYQCLTVPATGGGMYA
jgi:hypothetical protein